MTRPQFKLMVAYAQLMLIKPRSFPADLSRWLFVRFAKSRPTDLTNAQANHARRQLNAWRFSG